MTSPTPKGSGEPLTLLDLNTCYAPRFGSIDQGRIAMRNGPVGWNDHVIRGSVIDHKAVRVDELDFEIQRTLAVRVVPQRELVCELPPDVVPLLNPEPNRSFDKLDGWR